MADQASEGLITYAMDWHNARPKMAAAVCAGYGKIFCDDAKLDLT